MYYRQTLTKLNCLNKSMMKPACPLPSSIDKERHRERHRDREETNSKWLHTHTFKQNKNKPIYKM